MPDSTPLQSQYAAQIQSDLDSNIAEREQIAGQISSLQEQLSVLENNHALLASMQQAIGPASAAPAKGSTKGSTKGSAKAAKKTAGGAAPRIPQARTAAKSAGRATKKQAKPAVKAKASGNTPTLRDLVANHLAQSGEPRSAAEITAGLTDAHPQRNIAGTVVRNTLENLVAKGQAQRTRQNRSVFYTAPDATSATTAKESADGDVKKGADAVTPATTG
ncbi:hypothetical protein ACFXPM_08325 [Streptomyces sp. NPDC059095]|uniref:hypothetical protein n=1 Tax=Streptomyces sp. NPDC059095 TaxID=3346726 RepID=UPI0036B99A4F